MRTSRYIDHVHVQFHNFKIVENRIGENGTPITGAVRKGVKFDNLPV